MSNGERDGGGSDQTVPSLRTPFGTEVLDSEGSKRRLVPSAPPIPIPRQTAIVEEVVPAARPHDDAPASNGLEDSDDTEPMSTDDVPGDETPRLDGVVLGGRYRLDFELGRGGMGTVYAGRHLSLAIPIAVKVMLPRYAADPHWLRRFEREAKATSRLHQRNVVRVLDFGRHEGLPFLVMELLEGTPLSDWLVGRPSPPTLEEVAEVMLGIFDAFDAAHSEGIIHRDLKPDNVFLATESDGQQIVKILDFGLAHMTEPDSDTLTKAEMVAGTPEYMSPEQCRTLQVGPAADIYAMGCLLTEMLQLEPPFVGRTHVDVMTKQMFYEPPALRRGADAEPVPPLLERLRLDMLSKRAASRPASVREAKRRFVEALSAEAEAELLPPRKDAGPGGARQDRVPIWEAEEGDGGSPGRASRMRGEVGLWSLERRERGLDEMCTMALRARGARTRSIEGVEEMVDVDVVVLDAGSKLREALEVSRASGGVARVIVCLEEVTPEAMRELIEAGAAVVIPYPVEADKLARKVRRQLARAQRSS